MLSPGALIVAVLLACPSLVAAQSISGSGAIGAGGLVDGPVSIVDLGLDVSSDNAAIGVGGRLRLTSDGSLRRADWDELGELFHIIRYAEWSHTGDLDVALAAGDLYGTTLGTGALVDSFSTGLNIDHRPLAGDLGMQAGKFRARVVVDNVAGPNVLAARIEQRLGTRFGIALTSANDLAAPTMDEVSATGIVSGEAWLDAIGDHGWGRVSIAASSHLGEAFGAHLGASAGRGEGQASLIVGGELTAGTANYLPGYFHALYQVTRERIGTMRAAQLDDIRSRDLAGIGAALWVRGSGHFGDVRAAIRHRPALPPLASARLALPRFEFAQFAIVGSAEWQTNPVFVSAAELRIPMPLGLFATMEVARQYQSTDSGAQGVWFAMAALGAAIGE